MHAGLEMHAYACITYQACMHALPGSMHAGLLFNACVMSMQCCMHCYLAASQKNSFAKYLSLHCIVRMLSLPSGVPNKTESGLSGYAFELPVTCMHADWLTTRQQYARVVSATRQTSRCETYSWCTLLAWQRLLRTVTAHNARMTQFDVNMPHTHAQLQLTPCNVRAGSAGRYLLFPQYKNALAQQQHTQDCRHQLHHCLHSNVHAGMQLRCMPGLVCMARRQQNLHIVAFVWLTPHQTTPPCKLAELVPCCAQTMRPAPHPPPLPLV